MGYSCGRIASLRMDAISDACFKQTGMANTFEVNGNKYFYEIGKENRDGAITGTLNKFTENNRCKRAGTFRVEANGQLTRGPAFFKKVPFLIVRINTPTEYLERYRGLTPVTTDVLFQWLRDDWVKQWLKGGVNELVSGAIPYPNAANVINPDKSGGEVVATWKAPPFLVW